MSTTLTRIRWRLNDPADEWRQRWTRVHWRNGTTLCGVAIPDHPYDAQGDEWIPADASACKTCARKLEAR